MTPDLLLVLILLGVCVGLFVINRPRMDAVGLLVLAILPLTGILTVSETLSGFSDPNVVLIALLFVVGEGLVRTGIAYQIGDWLVTRAGASEGRLLVLLMLAVALLGSVMSSTGVVAIFIPITLGIAARCRIAPGKLMMPLSMAGLISGMLTLVATPPNLVVNSAMEQAGISGFRFFSPTPVGLVVLTLGIGYVLLVRHWLVSREPDPPPRARRRLLDFIQDYQLAGREHRVRIRPDSPLVGRTLRSLNPRREYGASVVGIERPNHALIHPQADTRLEAGDILLVDIAGTLPGKEIFHELGLDVLSLRGSYFTDQSRDVGMAELVVPPESPLLGKTLVEANVRTRYRLHVVGLRRGGRAREGGLLTMRLRPGDTLLVIGQWKAIWSQQAPGSDFVVLSLPAEVDQAAPAGRQAPLALLSLGMMVTLMVTGVVPNVTAALLAVLLMGLFRCVTFETAYRSIHWPSLLLIVGVMPFAVALQKTGGIALAAEGLMFFFGEASPHVLLGALFLLTALTGLFISNTATAVLMAPIALSLAAQLNLSPYPFAMTVALAASAAFMTPVSSPVNTLVLGPGKYRFGDFVRIGVPFTLLVMVATVILVPWLFPLK